jgi:membrane associated rhomboid family serine protease
MATNAVALRLPNPARVRAWINRLPFFTRVILLIVILAWIASLILPWIIPFGALIPSEVSIFAGKLTSPTSPQAHDKLTSLIAYRLNTFPLIHAGFSSALVSLIPLVPLLEHFESQHGTLVSFALFFGPFATIPGVLYIIINHFILRKDDPMQGSMIWSSLLLASEAVILHRRHPSFKLGDVEVPIWPFPIPLLVFMHFLLPAPILHDSLLGNLCGCVVGYGFEVGYLKFLVPPEKILRYIEGKLNLLGRLPHYVSVDQKTFGRYGSVLPLDEDGGRGIRRNTLDRRNTPVLGAVNGVGAPVRQ